MTKNQLLALAAFITSLANEGEGAVTTTTAETPAGDPPKQRRGRPASTPTPPAEQTQEPAQPQQPEKPAEPEKPKLTTEELEANYQKLRGIIAPHVKGGKGAEVKKVIASFKPDGWDAGTDFTTKELAAYPEKHDAFAKDIEALSY